MFETRDSRAARLRVERRSSGREVLVGLAAPFDSLSEDLGGFRERIHREAFDRTLKERPDVVALAHHNHELVLGRGRSRTLVLEKTAKGLRATIDVPPNTAGRDLLVSVRRGDLSSMSFGFRTVSDDWEVRGGEVIRELKDVDLIEVSCVALPAYLATTLTVAEGRSMTETTSRPGRDLKVLLVESKRRVLGDYEALKSQRLALRAGCPNYSYLRRQLDSELTLIEERIAHIKAAETQARV